MSGRDADRFTEFDRKYSGASEAEYDKAEMGTTYHVDGSSKQYTETTDGLADKEGTHYVTYDSHGY